MQGTNREDVIAGSTRRQAIMGAAMAFGGLVLGTSQARAEAEPEVSHVAELIHQEPTFKASRKRVYEALTDAAQFQRVILLSAAMKTMSLRNQPAEISTEAGGTLFGGYVTGRQIELVPNQRIVQAWRAGSWDPAFTQLPTSRWWSKDRGPKLSSNIAAFPKASVNTC